MALSLKSQINLARQYTLESIDRLSTVIAAKIDNITNQIIPSIKTELTSMNKKGNDDIMSHIKDV